MQSTPDAADRVRKLLALVDIKPYLNERDELSELGVQSVVDAFAHLSFIPTERKGLCVLKRRNSSPTSTLYGMAFHGGRYSLSGAFYQTHGIINAPWVMGLECRTHLQPGVCGMFRTISEGALDHPLTLHAKCGLGYMLNSISQLTVFTGGRGVLGNTRTDCKGNMACPMSTVWAMDTGVEWSARVGAHELRVGGEFVYRPAQSTPVRITDLGLSPTKVRKVPRKLIIYSLKSFLQ